MSNNIDLKELSNRENERIEWKENVANIEDVVKTITAFANDYSNLGGGYIVCGAKEGKDEHGFQKVYFVGLVSERFREIENKVLAHCREKINPEIVPLIEVIDVPDNPSRKVLVFIIAATGYAHSYRASGKDSSTYYIRIGNTTVEARNGLLRELLVVKNQMEPWDKRINTRASTNHIDLLVLRDYLQEMGIWSHRKALEDYLSDKEKISDFVPPLVGKMSLSDELRPKNFTLLMFGKNPLEHFDSAYTIFSVYRGKDRSEPTAERHEIKGSIVQQARRLIELLNAESYVIFDKNSSTPNQVKYPIRALQEAVVNAIVHRDYENSQPTRVTVFSDRVEINSPGSLPRAIDKTKFLHGTSSPHWRNQTLAYFFNKLQLAQAEGQGIPTILKTMRQEGCPDPIFELGPESVICILPAHPRHQIIKDLHEIENKIVIGNYADAQLRIESILQQDPYNFRAIDLFCELNNINKTPQKMYDFIIQNDLDLTKINSNTLISIAETLSLSEETKLRNLANKTLTLAALGQLEEKQILKIALNLKRLGKNEKVIEFINKILANHPEFTKNASFLEERARAKMNLAKLCVNSGKDHKRSPKIRARAWEECRKYLLEAEQDLNSALENVSSPIEKEYILQDINFLDKMKRMSQKPAKNDYNKRSKTTNRKKHG